MKPFTQRVKDLDVDAILDPAFELHLLAEPNAPWWLCACRKAVIIAMHHGDSDWDVNALLTLTSLARDARIARSGFDFAKKQVAENPSLPEKIRRVWPVVERYCPIDEAR